ncbi:transglutaminase [Nocardioides phosphati]|uniref:Transglutaminase n=1 Tax=Nocardioides phosphati TaxID=1867775 RepID=A0ABQ2N7X7_9ACTN|nr:transglutaminase [Nocardioides phosphati]
MPEGLPGKLLLAFVLVAAVGVGLRRLGLEWPFAFCGQLLTATVVLQAELGSRWVPTPSSLRTAVQSVIDALGSAHAHPAPVASDVTSIVPLLVVAGVALHLVVDLVAVSLRRPLAASLALLAAWVVPVSVLGTASAWPHFALAALAWLGLLAAEQRAERSRWGRPVDAPWFDAVRPGSAGVAIALVAVLAAVVLPAMLPQGTALTLPGAGPARDGTVSLRDPVADLQRDLTRGQDVDLLRINVPKSAPPPAYVRLSVLNQFDGASWRVGSRLWPASNGTVSGAFPAAPALALPGQRVPWEVAVTQAFASDWLPTPHWTSSLVAGPGWRYDSESLDVHRTDSQGSAAGETYDAVEYLPHLTAETLLATDTSDPDLGAAYTALPDSRPAWVHDVATRVTRGATTDYARAVALQQFFQRSFTYSTATAPGSGFRALGDFLNRSRSGYCEQFAAAMALLARELGMPARVSVGFLRPERRGPGSYEFSAHDLHAWPEIWFRGVGWVGFEPTPTSHTGSVPSWSNPPPQTTPSVSASPTTIPSTTPKPRQLPPEQDGAATGQASIDWRVPAVLGGLVLVALAVCLPRLVRRGQRARRLGSADVEDWWSELRADVVDVGITWPTGASPRATARALATRLERSDASDAPAALAALDRLVGSVELARYAPEGSGTATPDDVVTCAAALQATTSPRGVRRARWWPRSVVGQGRLRRAESA